MVIESQKSIYIDSHSTVDHNNSNDSDNKSNDNFSEDDKKNSNTSNINDDVKNNRYHIHICNMIMKIAVITMMMMT